MTEAATTTDSLAEVETTSDEAPAAEILGPEEFGAGLFTPDTSAEDLDDGTEQPEGAAEPADAQGAAVEPESNVETDEEQRLGTLRQEDYTQKTTALANDRRAFEQQQAEFQQRQQEWLNQQQAAINQQQAGPGAESESQRIRGLAQSAESQSDRDGFNYLADSIALNESMAQQIQVLTARLDQHEPQLQQTVQATQQIAQQRQNELKSELTKEQIAAEDVFGKDLVEAHKGFWANNLTMTKEDGSFFSIAELVAMRSGKSAEEAQAAKAANGKVRAAAKRQLPKPGPAGATSVSGPMTREQILAEMRQNDPSLT